MGVFIQILSALLTLGLSSLVFPFIYNKMYVKHLVGDGYRAQNASGDLNFISAQLKLPIPQVESML